MADGILLTNAHNNNCNVTIKAQQVNNINMWKQNTHTSYTNTNILHQVKNKSKICIIT